jgi:hypothetical protein
MNDGVMGESWRNWPPLVAAFQVVDGRQYFAPWLLLAVLAGLGVLANVPRIVMSLLELGRAARRTPTRFEPDAAPVQ